MDCVKKGDKKLCIPLPKRRDSVTRVSARGAEESVIINHLVLFSPRSAVLICPYRPNVPTRPPPDYNWSGMTWVWLKCCTEFKKKFPAKQTALLKKIVWEEMKEKVGLQQLNSTSSHGSSAARKHCPAKLSLEYIHWFVCITRRIT